VIVDSGQAVRNILVPAVHRALLACDGVFLAVGDGTARLLRAGLGAAAGELEWGQTSGLYHQRLGFAYEGFRRVLAAAHAAGRRIHVFAEPQLASDAADAGSAGRAAAYLAYEAICNETYADYGCPVTCVWDARHQSTLMIENVRAVHTHEFRETGWAPSPVFVHPERYLAGRNQVPLPLPAEVGWRITLSSMDDLPVIRAGVMDWAGRQGFTPLAAADVLLAVNEIATNGLVHGRPPVQVYGWRQQDTLTVQVSDRGGIPLPASAGYRPPDRTNHHGLWMARQLADVLQTHTVDSVTSVRLSFPHQLTHRDRPG
jgi:anti-sigma regulatory factor (Ser/Thr protein kinase)